MIVPTRSRAPLRLGLAGGGTDLSPYSDEFGGAVLNTTIGRYAFAFIEPAHESRVTFIADDLDISETFPADLDAMTSAKLILHAGVYRRMIRQFHGGRPIAMRVATSVDAPAGSGLGSSSALVVALVEAFRAALNIPLSPYEVAHLAFEIERLDLNLPGGKQDQYAAAFGGINFIEFIGGDRVIVNPLRVHPAALNEFETSIIVCFSGVSRNSEHIIAEQRHGMTKAGLALDALHQLKADAIDMKQALFRGDISEMARLLNRSWLAKKNTASGVSTDCIDQLLSTAMRAGALAGKVSGAGGGGFIMLVVPPEQRAAIIRALNNAGAIATGVEFTQRGAESWIMPGWTS